MARFAPIFQDRCSNNHPIGIHQHEFEMLALTGLKPHEVATKMGMMKMCCRNAVLNFSVYFIYEVDNKRFVDKSSFENITIGSTPLIEFTKKPPEFPLLPGDTVPNLFKLPTPVQVIPKLQVRALPEPIRFGKKL